jgi:O-antigen ligase
MISVGMITLLGSAILNIEIKNNWKSFLKVNYLLLITFYFLLLSISYFWSDDKHYFAARIQTILPFLILPFAFHSFKNWKENAFQYILFLFIFLNLIGNSYSLINYFSHKEMYDIGYSYSKVIPTPFKNDHIRYSIAVLLSIIFCVEIYRHQKNNFLKIVLLLIVLYDIMFLHILSAKTGLLAFYLVAFIFIFKLILTPKYRTIGLGSLLSIILLPFLMYQFSSTFKAKLHYVKYSFEQMKNANKESNISDEGRLISYDYALQSIKRNPIKGVGYGDIFHEMEWYYQQDFKGKNVNVLLPHNQFLVVGLAIGFLGIIYLLTLQIILFIKSYQNGFLTSIIWFIFFFAMMIEPFYETQFGTCLFLFMTLFSINRAQIVKSNMLV